MKKYLISVLLVGFILLTGCTQEDIQQETDLPVAVEDTASAGDNVNVQEDASLSDQEPVADEATAENDIDNTNFSDEEENIVQDYIYIPNEDYTALIKEPAGTEIIDVRQLVDLLVAREVLPEGTAISSLLIRDSGSSYPYVDSTSKYVVGSQWVELDMSSQFLQALEGRTAEQEALVMASLTNTLLGYYGLNEMTITCDGKQIETPNAHYNYDLTFMEVE